MDKTLEELYEDLDLVDLELGMPRLSFDAVDTLLLRKGRLEELIENFKI